MPKLNENKTNMADVIQDVGYFNVKDELVFVDENFCINLVEEEVVSEPLENKFIVFDSVSSDVTSSVPNAEIRLECETSSESNFSNGDHLNNITEVKNKNHRDVDNFDSLTEVKNKDTFDSDLDSFDCITEVKNEDTFDSAVHSSPGNPNESSTEENDSLHSTQSFNSDENHASFSNDQLASHRLEQNGKRVWACKQCDKTFISRKGSIIHQRTHTGERPFTCNVCNKKFIDSSTLMKHQVIHQATRPFSCSTCHRGFNQKVALQRHESTHSLQPLFNCKYCPKTFLVRSSLQAHENIHSRIKPYVCSFCPSRFHTLTLQKQHERVHTNERPYQCNYCPKAFKDSGTLFKHQVIHSGVKPYSCPLCSNGFTQKVAVRKHIRTHVLKGASKQCQICKVTLINPNELSLHLEKHVLENPHSTAKPSTKVESKLKTQRVLSETKPADLSDLATLCDVAISTSGNYFSNALDINSVRGRFYCFYCGMRYKRERTLNSHLFGVHLFCVSCSTKFYDRETLDSHDCKGQALNGVIGKVTNKPKMKTNKQFSCEKCYKSFNSRNGFVIHQRSHTGERPYACRWCDKAFGDSATRHKHERIHTGERPFKCVNCPRAFNQRAALRAHLGTHSCNRTFKCEYCPSSFRYSSSLCKHVEACHSDSLQVSCPLCAKVSLDPNSLHDHIRFTHVVEGESHVCTLCDSGVFTLSAEYCDHLVWHAKQHILDFYRRYSIGVM